MHDADLTVHAGEKLALIGRNGAGKSSLFALLCGQLHEDRGEVLVAPDWRIAQVSQSMPQDAGTATDFVLAGDTRLMSLQDKLQQLEAAGDGMALARVHSDLADAGAHDARARAESLILGLGFAVDELQHPVNSFSGGWRMRLQLARALMAPSDLLLLDEPTNHLDLDALVWLESWLQRYEGTLIVISHDREFLDACTQVTVHLNAQQLTRYKGNYSAFEDLRAQQLRLQQASHDKQQKKAAHLQSFIDRFRAKASKAKQAQSRIKALERMQKIAPILAEAEFEFAFQSPDSIPNPMLVMDHVSLGYAAEVEGAEDAVILPDVKLTIMAGQRIGVLGANGQGKSTLIKSIAGVLPCMNGQMRLGKHLSVAYFAQHELDVLQLDAGPLEHMRELARHLGREHEDAAREQSLRDFLGRFQFSGEMALQPIRQFSGGEKARLVLAMLVWQRPNLLLLDEPTNHLDLNTRQALASALNDFDGSLLLVSHDRALLRQVCDDFWLVAQGQVKPFDGDMDDYRRHLLEVGRLRQQGADARTASTNHVDAATTNRSEQRRLRAEQRRQLAENSKVHRQAIARTEKRMQAIEEERLQLHRIFEENADARKMAEASKRLGLLDHELQELETRWLEHSAAMEEIMQLHQA